MLCPSKQKIIVVGSGGIQKNPYPAFESINLSLNHSATSFAIFAPLVLPQPNVLLVTKHLPPPKKGGFDLGLTKPQHLLNASSMPLLQNNESMDGGGQKEIKEATENLFSYPIKVLTIFLVDCCLLFFSRYHVLSSRRKLRLAKKRRQRN